MDGQYNIFDFIDQTEPKVIPEFAIELFFDDGFAITKEFNESCYGMWDDLIAKHGIIIDYKCLRGFDSEKKMRFPCMLICEVEWCSLACFLKRGYIRHDGKWVRDEKGKILISKNKECEWTPREDR